MVILLQENTRIKGYQCIYYGFHVFITVGLFQNNQMLAKRSQIVFIILFCVEFWYLKRLWAIRRYLYAHFPINIILNYLQNYIIAASFITDDPSWICSFKVIANLESHRRRRLFPGWPKLLLNRKRATKPSNPPFLFQGKRNRCL